MSIRLDSMLKAVQLPAGVSDLTTRLTDVHGDTFTHVDVVMLPTEGIRFL